ncbi:dehydrogenase [Xylaria bambusicola]|uniref:dehydrogenase n=1 Tax=Xylaria bambusicola TaxID=326684 RepID=UPI002008016B|nr:dehydrogenase [Xylaria bambusicola]KAI0525405.1 dehydrogenase [Xylaria bambusicola]
MRALRYYGPKDLRLETDLPEPKCGSTQVKIRPAFVGICGTDLHEYQSQTFIPKYGSPHPLTNESSPVTLGHEISGTIIEIGSNVSNLGDLKVGDRVAVFPLLCCRTCEPCKGGFPNCCVDKGFLGLSGGGGGLSDYICVQPEAVFKLPDSISLEVGALVEPLAVAWHAVNQSAIEAGQASLVFGTGPIGLSIIQCLRAIGAGSIIAVDMVPQRQQLAKKFGATHILDPTRIDVSHAVRELTGGNGPPVAFDCAGVPLSLEATIRSVCARGTIINVAIWEKPVALNPNDLVFHERKYIGSLTYQLADFGHVIDALRTGHLKPEAMITSKVSLDRAIEDGFEALIHQRNKHIKLMVDLSATAS